MPAYWRGLKLTLELGRGRRDEHRSMGQISELFWRLFQSSGHVGAYLLYTDYRGLDDVVRPPQDSAKQGVPGRTHVDVRVKTVGDRVTGEG